MNTETEVLGKKIFAVEVYILKYLNQTVFDKTLSVFHIS